VDRFTEEVFKLLTGKENKEWFNPTRDILLTLSVEEQASTVKTTIGGIKFFFGGAGLLGPAPLRKLEGKSYEPVSEIRVPLNFGLRAAIEAYEKELSSTG
jgi:hypothetical protein